MGISSMPFLVGDAFLVFGFLFTLFLFLLRGKALNPLIMVYSAVYLLLFVGHVFFFEKFELFIFVAFFIRIFYAYFTIKLIGARVGEVFIKIMTFFSTTSIIIYFLLLVVPGFESFLVDTLAPPFYRITLQQDYKHILIYTVNFRGGLFLRNPGPFWEAGGFAVFLNLALMLNLIRKGKLWNMQNSLFMVNILTTQSTGGYVTLIALLVTFVWVKQQKIIALAMVAILLLSVYYVSTVLPFLGEKINEHIEFVSGANTDFLPRTRFVSALEDYKTFLESPFIGKGRFLHGTADNFNNKTLEYRNNGTSNYFAVFGLAGVLFFFGMMTYSFRLYCQRSNFSTQFAYFLIVVMLVMGFSQQLFYKPFFMGFSFMFVVALKGVQRPITRSKPVLGDTQ